LIPQNLRREPWGPEKRNNKRSRNEPATIPQLFRHREAGEWTRFAVQSTIGQNKAGAEPAP